MIIKRPPRPRPTRPRVPYLMSPNPKSPHTRPNVPVPVLYTAMRLEDEREMWCPMRRCSLVEKKV